MMQFASLDVFSRPLTTLHDFEMIFLTLACHFLGLFSFDWSMGVEHLLFPLCIFLQIR